MFGASGLGFKRLDEVMEKVSRFAAKGSQSFADGMKTIGLVSYADRSNCKTLSNHSSNFNGKKM